MSSSDYIAIKKLKELKSSWETDELGDPLSPSWYNVPVTNDCDCTVVLGTGPTGPTGFTGPTGTNYWSVSGNTISPLSTYTNLSVSNSITSSSYTSTSDYRIKKDLVLLSETDFSVDLLNPYFYFNKITENHDIGFIAHELKDTFPFLVKGEKDGENNQSINYQGLIGVLTNEIKNLKKEVEEIKIKNK